MAKNKVIQVLPIFSLKDERLKGLLSSRVLFYEDVIEKALQKYGDHKIGPREISVDLLNIRLRNIVSCNSESLQKAIYIYYGRETVTHPFLLGLATEQKFLSKINDILSIEIFEEEQLFFDERKRASQLCLRRTEKNWIVDISTYVHKNLINAGERESGNSINTLSFIEETQTEEES